MVSEDNCLIETILSSRSSHLRVIHWLLFVSVASNTSRCRILSLCVFWECKSLSWLIFNYKWWIEESWTSPSPSTTSSNCVIRFFAIGIESTRFRWSSQTTIAFSPQSKRILVTELYPVTPLRQLLWRLADVLIADTQWRADTDEEYDLLLYRLIILRT